MRLFLSFLLFLPVLSVAQDAVTATLKTGSTAAQLVLPVGSPPGPGDRIDVETSTGLLQVSISTPDGRVVTSATAESDGLTWDEARLRSPSDSADTGKSVMLWFKAAAKPGEYIVHLASPALRQPATVSARFVRVRDEYDQMFKQLPEAQRLGPFVLDPSRRTAELAWVLTADENDTMLDVVVTDPAAKVGLTLPDGTIVTPQSQGIAWWTGQSRDGFDASGDFLSFSSLLLPREGTHHVITLPIAFKGAYAVRVTLGTAVRAEVEAMVLPLEKLFDHDTSNLLKEPLPEGTVHVQFSPLPHYSFAGDKLALAVQLEGGPVAGPVRFEVQVEISALLPDSATGRRTFGKPRRAVVPVRFDKLPDGSYRGVLALTQPGLLHVGLKASGTTASGRRFSEEAIPSETLVTPLVASFVSLSERAVDDDGNGRPDRLEVTSLLDVRVPGKYQMRFEVSGSDAIGVVGTATATLPAGRQKLSGSMSAARLHTSLGDGPYQIRNVRLLGLEENTFGYLVKGEVAPLATAAYRRDQWDSREVRSPAGVDVRLMRPGKSGKFTAIEVTWEVETRGGECHWMGDLGLAHTFEAGYLPRGQNRLSLVFDARALAAQPTGLLSFTGHLVCQGRGDGAGRTTATVAFNPAQIEPRTSPVRVFCQTIFRIVINQPQVFMDAMLEMEGAKALSPSFRVTSVPDGLTATVYGNRLEIAASQALAPGRYFVGIEGTAGSETDTGEIVVDVVTAP